MGDRERGRHGSWPIRYSTRKIRTSQRSRGIKTTIPEPANQIAGHLGRGNKGGRPPAFDREAYKRRNAVERAFNKLCGSRGRPLREFVYKGTIDVATIRIWLRDPTLSDLRDTA